MHFPTRLFDRWRTTGGFCKVEKLGQVLQSIIIIWINGANWPAYTTHKKTFTVRPILAACGHKVYNIVDPSPHPTKPLPPATLCHYFRVTGLFQPQVRRRLPEGQLEWSPSSHKLNNFRPLQLQLTEQSWKVMVAAALQEPCFSKRVGGVDGGKNQIRSAKHPMLLCDIFAKP